MIDVFFSLFIFAFTIFSPFISTLLQEFSTIFIEKNVIVYFISIYAVSIFSFFFFFSIYALYQIFIVKFSNLFLLVILFSSKFIKLYLSLIHIKNIYSFNCIIYIFKINKSCILFCFSKKEKKEYFLKCKEK